MSINSQSMEQQELPFALVRGEKLVEKPLDLYIPDDAMEVTLTDFEGPLDLLLYLIKKQKFDIANLPIAPISVQYLNYIESFESLSLDLSSEYLVMAATLALIKSKLLLPKPEVIEEEEDPRAELVRRLQEYQQIKQAALLIDELPRLDREHWLTNVESNIEVIEQAVEDVDLSQLVKAFQATLNKQAAYEHHHIQKEALSTQDKIAEIVAKLAKADSALSLHALIIKEEGRQGVLVTFLAILELIKGQRVRLMLDETQDNLASDSDTRQNLAVELL